VPQKHVSKATKTIAWKKTTPSKAIPRPTKPSPNKIPTIPKKVIPVASITQSLPKYVAYAMPSPSMDFVRTIPLGLPRTEAQLLQTTNLTLPIAQTLLMNDNTSAALHMEVIRLAHQQFTPPDQQKLLYALYQRYQKNNTNPRCFFDYGWAQLALQRNKTGLFFLRKANDRLAHQDTMLAYAMAQIEADLVAEGNPPEEPTVRKTDVMFKLKDAIALQMEQPKQGFWPTYVRLLDRLKPFAAYESFVARDYSLQLFPRVAVKQDYTLPSPKPLSLGAASQGKPLSANPPLSTGITMACSVNQEAYTQATSGTFLSGEWVKVPMAKQGMPNNLTDASYRLLVYQSQASNKKYHAVVANAQQQPVMVFMNLTQYRLQEDPNGDGIPELVIRQYADNPLDPVAVYSFQPQTGCYTRHTEMTRIFQ
jgi:hypothetical protein